MVFMSQYTFCPIMPIRNAVWDTESENKTLTNEETVAQDYILILLSYYLAYIWFYHCVAYIEQ